MEQITNFIKNLFNSGNSKGGKAAEQERSFGWKPDLPDHRDLVYSAAVAPSMAALPTAVDLSHMCPPVVDQGKLGSCTGNAWASAHALEQLKQNRPNVFYPSRLFIYYNERVMENTVSYDAGASIRSGVKSLAKLGVCSEKLWPYNVNRFRIKPTKSAYAAALKNQVVRYLSVNNTNLFDIRSCLAAGYPIVFGFMVYSSFQSKTVKDTGEAQMPATTDSALGGHAVMMVGYNDRTKRVKCLNSWGPNWGDHGYFTLPYDYVTNRKLASDFWTLRLIEA